ncbi:unnamed protein product [Cylindrotheca closterium]|uniref:Uncharacterized protein n=1 Tax=Cylindrotheca closterium TaxID=2856 RepID=A0AAD2FQI5_9STRA|nr:unnamed protein product [Cylindrotheca closterium]
MSPIEVPSYISHQQVENRRPSFSNAPTILPSNPTTVSQKSSTGSHDITTQKSQNTAKYVSQHVLSATVETNPKRWTVEEDNVLAMAVESQNGRVSNWNLLASTFFPGSRTGSMCKARWWKKTPIGSKIKGNWMPDEDAKISKLRSEGFTWRAIATQCPGRCYEQVMSRYYDHLDPSVVTAPWTAAEHRILFQEQSRVGNNWKQISQLLPGRSTNQVKNRWYQIQRQFGLRKQTKPSSVKKTRKKVHNGHLVYSVLTNPWTEPEDKILIREHSRLGKKWTQISKLLPGRSPDQLKNRWKQIQRRSGLEKQTEPS